MDQPDRAAVRSRRRRALWRSIAVAAVLALVLIGPGCNGLFYHPDRVAYRSLQTIRGGEDVRFESGDGTSLHGWFLHASGKPRGTIVFFHGNAQNLTSHISFVDWLPERGFNVFAFDYRGYGKSAGSPSRVGLYRDSLAALEYVRGREDVDENRIIVFAQSLGGACATSALGGGEAKPVRGLVLDSTFAFYIGMGNEVLGGTFLTYPLAWLLLSNARSPGDVVANIAPTPLLFFHSTNDPVVPMSQGRELFELAKDPKQFVELKMARHPVASATRLSRERLVQFFDACLREK